MSERELNEYSRGRADAEAEKIEQFKSFARFINRKKDDAKRALKEYLGNQNPQAKLMASHYRSEIYAFEEALNWLEWFLEVTPDE